MTGFSFNYKNKKLGFDVKVLKTVRSQVRGLMFRKKSKPLLFIFKNKKRRAIHSFFCKPFVAFWFNENKIIDVKIIKTWKLSILPKEKFDKLLEVPFDNFNLNKFIDEEKL